MRKLSLIIAVFIFSTQSYAQKVGVVDTNYILSKLPQYKDAESRLDTQIALWRTDLQKMQTDYEKKKESFENERVLLIGDQLKQREKELTDMEAEIRKTIDSKFAADGEMNKQRAALAKPYQDQIWNAIKTVSTKNNLGIVLDKSNNISVIYLDKKYDYTDAVLSLLIKTLPPVEDKKSPATKPGVNSSSPSNPVIKSGTGPTSRPQMNINNPQKTKTVEAIKQ